MSKTVGDLEISNTDDTVLLCNADPHSNTAAALTPEQARAVAMALTEAAHKIDKMTCLLDLLDHFDR